MVKEPGPTGVAVVAKVTKVFTAVTPMVPVRKPGGNETVTNCTLNRTVEAVNANVRAVPTAKRTAAAMLTETPVTWPPSATVGPVADMSVVVVTMTPLAEAARALSIVTPVRVSGDGGVASDRDGHTIGDCTSGGGKGVGSTCIHNADGAREVVYEKRDGHELS